MQHRTELLLLALVICAMAATTTVMLLRQVRKLSGPRRWRWYLAAGIAMAVGAWATHFVSLLAFNGRFVAGYALQPTIVSLLVALAGVQLAILGAALARNGWQRAFATVLFTATLGAMHYIGMDALSVPALMHWNIPGVVASLVLPLLPFHAGLRLALSGRGLHSGTVAVAVLSGGVGLLHFTAMAALTLVPSRIAGHGTLLSPHMLADWISLASVTLFAIAISTQIVRQRAGSAFAARNLAFSILLRSTSDHAICMLGRDGRVLQSNTGTRTLLGWEEAEVLGNSFAVFFNDEERAAGEPARMLEAARDAGSSAAIRLAQRRDGSHFWAHGTLERIDDDGAHFGFSLIIKDVSSFQEAQDTIAQTSLQLDTALEHMREGLALFDEDERLVLCNRRFRELWRLAEDDSVPGATLGRLIAAGFMNAQSGADPEGDCARQLWAFRQLLNDALGDERGAPACVDFGDRGVFSIANGALPNGGWVTTCTDITEQRRSEARIEHMALHDALTGLPNRAKFTMAIDRKLEIATRQNRRVAVIAIDLDRFKEVNDVYGHAAGDLLLQGISRRFAESQRDDEVVARLGGDEFAAARIYEDQAELGDFLARLQACITTPVVDGEQPISVGASIGVAVFPQDGDCRESLLNAADLAMYRAKTSLGTSICYFEPAMDERARARRQIAADLRQAIVRGEFSVAYQPQRSLRLGALSGYEALLRWQHPQRGMVPPDIFIPIAEETGEILAIGAWVLRQACVEAQQWPDDLKVAVNLSAVQFLQPDLVDVVRTILVETGLSPRRLELEITETAIITDKLRALHCLRQIKAMGISVAIDDFGTGYSSLDTLQSFPFDRIKIDKSFLLQADTSGQARAIIRAVLALGRSLDIPVLAEGVENEAQLRVLQSEGCDEAQGYFFGHPGCPPSLAERRAASA